MAIETVTYIGSPGTYSTSIAKLANVTILGLKREGTHYKEVASSPGNFEFSYISGSGTIEFNSDNKFLPAVVINGRNNLERVWVLIKT